MAERALRGSRLGAVSYENADDAAPAERQFVGYTCVHGHQFEVPFAVDAEVPPTWECRLCGSLAAQRNAAVPEAVRNAAAPEGVRVKSPRSHWDMLLERRSIPELEAILAERLGVLRTAGRRKSA